MKGDNRARLTLPDVMFLLVSFAFVAALYGPVSSIIDTNSGDIDPGTSMLLNLVLPGILLVMLFMLMVKAASGVR